MVVLWPQMVDELVVAFGASLVYSVIVWFGLGLNGDWILFWLTYYCTLSIGIGEGSDRSTLP